METDFEHVQDLLPDGAVPVQQFRIAVWLDPLTGEEEWKVDWAENCPLRESVGILEVIKHALICEKDED